MPTAMIRVLLVDDEPALLEITGLYLRRAGVFSVETVSSGREALDRLATTRYDAVVSDYEMPGMNGIELLIALRSRGDTSSFIVFTGRGREHVVIEALNNGADFYLQKGGDPKVQFAELHNMIEQAVRRKRMEQEVLLNGRRLEALVVLNQMRGAPIHEITDFALRSAIDLTGSTIGFLAFVNDDGSRLSMHSWSTRTAEACRIEHRELEFEMGSTDLFGSSIRDRRPVIVNDYSGPGASAYGTPPGHLEIRSYLEVPVVDGGRCVAVAAVANRADPYTEIDVRQATLLFEGLWQLLERERAELALRMSEERYRAVVESQTELISRFLPDGTHVFANEAFCRYYGMSYEELVGHRFHPNVPVEEQARLGAHFAGLTTGHPVGTIEHRVGMADGEVRWQQWSDRAIFDPQGRVLEYQSVGRDVTEKKRFEEALSESEHKFKVLAERSLVGIYIIVNNRLTYANPRFAEIFGRPIELLLGTVFEDLIAVVDQAAVGLYLWELGSSESGTAHAEFNGHTPSGRPIVIEVYGSRTVIGGSAGIIGTVLDITDRKGMEKALIEKVNYVQALMDTIPAPVFYRDTDGVYQDCNRAFEGLVDLPRSEILGKTIHDFFPKEYADVYKEKDALIINRPYLQRYEFAITDANGVEHDVMFSKTAQLRADGTVAGVVGVILDISDRKEMERELSEQVNYVKALMDTIPAPVFYRDCAGVYRDCNRAFEALVDLPRSEILGKTIHDFFPREFAEIYRRRDDELIADPGIQQYEYQIPDAHGVVYDVLFSKTTLLSAAGTVAGIVGVIVDISERKRVEAALRMSEEKYRLLADFTYDLEAWRSPDGSYRHVSPSCERITGYPPADFIANPGLMAEIAHPSDRVRVTAHMRTAVHAGTEVYHQDYRILTRDGRTRWISHFKKPVYRPDGTWLGWRENLRDVSERKWVEEALQLANRKLNLLNCITRHDVLNQLTALLGLLECSRTVDDPSEIPALVERMEEAADAIRHQITFTKDYQDIGVHSPVWQNVRDAIGRISPASGALVPGIGEELGGVEVYADPLLERVFFNLVDNSVRHGGSGRVRFHGHEADGHYVIVCDDDGEGVPEELKEAIFEQGYGRNTGYGLFLVREILSITGLSIQETGLPGEGARFEILVPMGAVRRASFGTGRPIAVIPD